MNYSETFEKDFAKNARYQGGQYLIQHEANILIADTPTELKEKYAKAKRDAFTRDNPQSVVRPTLKDLFKGQIG